MKWIIVAMITTVAGAALAQQAPPARVPQVRVLAMVGSEPMRWPAFTAGPLDDGRFWEYVERGEIVDLAPVIVHDAGGACWVPSQNPGRAVQGHGCVVVRRNLQSVGGNTDLGRRYIDSLRTQEERLAEIVRAEQGIEQDIAAKRQSAEQLARQLTF